MTLKNVIKMLKKPFKLFWFFFTKFKKCAKNRQKISLNILGLICRIKREKRRPSSFKEYPQFSPFTTDSWSEKELSGQRFVTYLTYITSNLVVDLKLPDWFKIWFCSLALSALFRRFFSWCEKNLLISQGTLKSVCSSWFGLISRDKYEYTHLRVPTLDSDWKCRLTSPGFDNFKTTQFLWNHLFQNKQKVRNH